MNTPMKRIRKFLRLSGPDQWLLIHAFVVLALVVLGLRILPWPALQSLLLKVANWTSHFLPAQRPAAQNIARSIKVASWYIPKATCLPQALAAQHLLIQYSYLADLQIGVAKNKHGLLEAHAWLSSEGNVLIGGVHDLDRLVVLSPTKREDIEDYARAT
jgi:hypothetical protein